MTGIETPKALVVCCDGTWQKADNEYVSNVEKIARAVAPVGHAGEPQIVYYQRGVGSTGSRIERLLAGAVGIGLDDKILDCYYFLALNYRPGDRISVFGFSRGAYTARSLIGMISYVGLLRHDALAGDHLRRANTVYRGRPARDAKPDAKRDAAQEAARAEVRTHCYDAGVVRFDMLGVFDTVGALGVPGVTLAKYRFHDVDLSDQVSRARQALALGERRRVFEPCLWGGEHRDIRQVWFDGVHLDVGGGYENCYYSDRSLLWMIGEAEQAGRLTASADAASAGSRAGFDDYPGLRFDWSQIGPGLCTLGVPKHDSLKFGYRVANVLGRIRGLFHPARRGAEPPFVGGWRTLAPTVDTPKSPNGRAYDVRIESRAGAAAANPNVQRWLDEVKGVLEAAGDPAELEHLGNLYVTVPDAAELSAAASG
ncbi:DUF2235 domain-containing protein [Tsukamurella sp. 1534]|uniref:DUF2235 domain-containing protein n=1 Tax=Tsukamurella sp. 1534 TaxID=1151061 RepID=UPI000A30CA70|nr:DUF2235 domain-containing protein [Tsukamurella sp. 1534]